MKAWLLVGLATGLLTTPTASIQDACSFSIAGLVVGAFLSCLFYPLGRHGCWTISMACIGVALGGLIGAPCNTCCVAGAVVGVTVGAACKYAVLFRNKCSFPSHSGAK